MDTSASQVDGLQVTENPNETSSPAFNSASAAPLSPSIPIFVMTPPPEDTQTSNRSRALDFCTSPPTTIVPESSRYYRLSVSQLVEDIETLQNDILNASMPVDVTINDWIEDELAQSWAVFCQKIYDVFLHSLACAHCGERPLDNAHHQNSAFMEEICNDVMRISPDDNMRKPAEFLAGMLEYLEGVEKLRRDSLAEDGCAFVGVAGNGSA